MIGGIWQQDPPQGEVSDLIENIFIDNWTPHGRLPKGYILFNNDNGNFTNMCFCISFYDWNFNQNK